MFTKDDVGRRVKDGDLTGIIVDFCCEASAYPVRVRFDSGLCDVYTADGARWEGVDPTLELTNEWGDFVEVMRWLVDRGDVFVGAIVVDDRLYYTDSNTDMESLYQIYRLERGE